MANRVLQVNGYRGLKAFRVDPVKDVNLFVGRNNIGKTSLLEAVHLARSRSPIASLRSNAFRRGEIRFLDPEVERAFRPNSWGDLSHAFFGRKVIPGARIRVSFSGSTPVSVAIQHRTREQGGLFEEGGPEFVLVAERGSHVDKAAISQDGVLPEQQRRPALMANAPEPHLFLTTEGLGGPYLAGLFNEVTRRGEEKLLVDALQILDDRVRSVHALTNPAGLEPQILLDRNGAGRQPIGSFGEGMKRLWALAVAIVNSAEGTLLVDEIDTGLHHSIHQKMWALVFRSSAERNVQVFATTHSLDCLQGLRWALEAHPDQAARVAVHKIVGDAEEAITFSGDELLSALQNDVELR